MDLVGCTVSNVARSLAFYRDTLGLQPSMSEEGGAEFEFPDGTTFGIWKPEGGGFPLGCSVMFAVDDARAAVALFNSRGANIQEPFDSPVCLMAMGSDPDGNAFVIHERKAKNDPVPPKHVRTPTSVNGIDWAGYFVSDPERSVAFYRDVLGMEPTQLVPGHGGEFTLADGSTFGVWHDENTPAVGGTLMFSVDDANATVDLLRGRGQEIAAPVDNGPCLMAFATDPDRIVSIVHQRK